MALKSTIYKAELNISDMNRNSFGEFALTIARHPSETEERMMIRLVAFALNASPRLVFGKGLSTEDESDIYENDLTGNIKFWIDVGLPDERRILKACGRADNVLVYTYANASAVWWAETAPKVAKAKNLTVLSIPSSSSQKLTEIAERNMKLQCTVQDDLVWISSASHTVELKVVNLMVPSK